MKDLLSCLTNEYSLANLILTSLYGEKNKDRHNNLDIME